MMHLEFWKSIEFKVGNKRPLGITHMVLFILQWCSINILSVAYSMAKSIADLGWLP